MFETRYTERTIAPALEQLRAAVQAGTIDWSGPPEALMAELGHSEGLLIDLEGAGWYGPLETWMHQATIGDILVNGPGRPVVVSEAGVRRQTDIRLHSSWISFAQRQLLLGSAMASECEWGNWSGATAIGTAERRLRYALTRAPASPDGPTIAVRLLPTRWRTLDELCAEDVLASDVAELLLEAVRSGVTLLIAGGAGSGKTTLAAALLQALGATRRVVVIEEATELPQLPDSVAMETLHSGMAFAACVRFALRQRPDLIAVGEVRGPEALALLQAAASGHPGIGTIHAADPQTALRNLERMACESGDAPPAVVRGLIASGAVPMLVAHVGHYGPLRRVGRVEEVLPQGAGGASGDRYPAHTLIAYDAATGTVRREGWVQGAWGRGRV
jgi:Flp pilus assembly CpaF family ATPase